MINPELQIGDRIILYHMHEELDVPIGSKGTVTNVTNDPFEDGFIISVDWDNGSKLNLLSNYDKWKKIKNPINEQNPYKQYDYMFKNPEIFENFDWRFLKEFLNKIRDSGIVNMFGSSTLLYAGKDWIDRHYGDMDFDEDNGRSDLFQEVLQMADEAKHKMIQGTIKSLEKRNEEIDIDLVNSQIKKFASKILNLYMTFS